jgi:hypothetical protein
MGKSPGLSTCAQRLSLRLRQTVRVQWWWLLWKRYAGAQLQVAFKEM